MSYDAAKADALLELMHDGTSLTRACAEIGVSRVEFFRWREANPDDLMARYARAREAMLDRWADDILDIADDGRNDTYKDSEGLERVDHDHINRSKLRTENRKWLLSKLKPDQYGDKSTQSIDLTLKGEDPASVLAARRKAREGE